jgi:hypothetical protein
MEPNNEAEMTAVLRARQVAKREKLRLDAEGVARWGAALPFVQVVVVYLLAMWLEGGRHSSTSILAVSLSFILTADIVYFNRRVDAIVRLMSENSPSSS